MAKTRTVGVDIVSRIAAAKIVKPYFDGVGFMTGRVAFMEAILAKGQSRPQLRIEASELADEARVQLKALDVELSDAPQGVVNHEKVLDLRAALFVVVRRLDLAHAAL